MAPVRRPLAVQMAPFLLCDTVAVLLAGSVVVLLRQVLGGQLNLPFYLRMSIVALLFLSAYAVSGLYPAIVLHPVMELQRICRGTTVSVLLLATLSFFHRDVEAYSRTILLGAWLLIIVFVWSGRSITRHWLGQTDWWGEGAVIIGAGRAGRHLAETLRRSPGAGLRPLAILDDRARNLDLARGLAPITAPLNAALTVGEELGIRYAIVAMPHRRGRDLAEIVERYASRFHHVLIIPDLFGISSLGVDARDLGGILGLKVSHRLLHRTPQAVKRGVDLVIAALGGILLLPCWISIAFLIRITSPGPILYGHERVGRSGRTFTAWKFRTMLRNADDVLQSHLEVSPALHAEWARSRKLKNDPRVTWIGKLLRRTSLDELPQLWNILRGDMSFVGPRPIVQAETERYGSKYILYKKVRPGLTGLWQVSGRNNTSYEERVRLDEYYVRNCSVWLDLYIIGKTIKIVLTGEGAY